MSPRCSIGFWTGQWHQFLQPSGTACILLPHSTGNYCAPGGTQDPGYARPSLTNNQLPTCVGSRYRLVLPAMTLTPAKWKTSKKKNQKRWGGLSCLIVAKLWFKKRLYPFLKFSIFPSVHEMLSGEKEKRNSLWHNIIRINKNKICISVSLGLGLFA